VFDIKKGNTMKQNITLSIDKELLKKGKIMAAHLDTSISKMLSDILASTVQQNDQYEAAKRGALRTLEQGFHLGGQINWTRESLYDR
jgi:hypothetical protein